MEEIRSRLDWIGVDFIDESENDDGGESDGKRDGDADGQPAVTNNDATKKEKKEVRLLDYACGPGMVSRVSLPVLQPSLDSSPFASALPSYIY